MDGACVFEQITRYKVISVSPRFFQSLELCHKAATVTNWGLVWETEQLNQEEQNSIPSETVQSRLLDFARDNT